MIQPQKVLAKALFDTYITNSSRESDFVLVRPALQSMRQEPPPSASRYRRGGHLRLFQRHGALQAQQERPRIKKLLAYEKEVNEGFTKLLR
jgi:hypothetical protein